jgi:hypothetical protein
VTAAWHALLAPLPDEARPEVQPVLPPEIAARPESAAVAGWRSVRLYLPAGAAGSRHLLVTLDETNTAISAGDWVVQRIVQGDEVTWIHDSIGGRLERDGRFLGTRWHSVAVGVLDSDDAEKREQQRFEPSADEAARLKALATELIRRSGSEGFVPEL